MKTLLFFNNRGEQLPLSTTPTRDYYTGTIFLESSSVGLYASESIHVVEQVGEEYGYPITTVPITANSEFGTIQFYSVENNATVSLHPDVEYPVSTEFPNTSCRINYCIEGKEAGVYTDYVYIRLGDIVISLTVHAEFIGEDDRLVSLLSNIGEVIGEDEYRIFRDSDLTGDGVNYSLLNAKRKEYLLEAHSIKPYIGSYKGVINILKFFGFQDLTIKEYWKNLATGVHSYETIHSYETHGQNIINGVLQKTSMFGLFYDVTVPVGWDEYGTPIRKKNFQYSNDEIILKLFALQRYISNKGIGGTSKLIDIVGQHYFYSTNLVSTWVDSTRSTNITGGEDIKVEVVSGTVGYLTDLRPTLLPYSDAKGRDLIQDWNPTNKTALGYYSHLDKDEWEVKEDPKVIIGHRLVATHLTFDKTWEDIDVPWNRYKGEENLTWNSMFHTDYYEVRWVVSLRGGDTRTIWGYSETQVVSTINTLSVTLPYVGTYSVECLVFKYGGVILRSTNYVEVRPPVVDFYHWYKYTDPRLQHWDGLQYLTWRDMEGDWYSVQNTNVVTPVPEKFTTYSGAMIGYYNSLVGNKRYADAEVVSWKELGQTTWDQSKYLTWENCIFHTDTHQKVILDSITPGGGTLVLNGVHIPIPNTIATLKQLELYLIEEGWETEIRGQVIHRIANYGHEFIDVIITTYDTGREGIKWGSDCVGIHSTYSRESWEDYTIWEDWGIWSGMTWSTLLEHCSPAPRLAYYTPTNVIISTNASIIPPLTTVYCTPDASAMVRPNWFTWKLSMNGVVIHTSTTELWSYTFIVPGTYTIECTIRDYNNNENTIVKDSIITVVTAEEFEQHLLEQQNTIV